MNSYNISKSEISLFMILFLTSSFTVINDLISSFMTILLWVVVAVYLFFSIPSVQSNQSIALVLLLAPMFISVIMNEENMRNAICVCFSIITAFFYSSIYDFQSFKQSFIKVMQILCIISLIGFFAFLLIPDLNNYFVVYNVAHHRYSNLHIYTQSAYHTRNSGMFWEPGAFQSFIVLATLFEMTENKPNVKGILLFIVTVITTFSTAGYLGMALVLFISYVRRDKGENRTKAFVTVAAMAAVIFILLNQELFFSTSEHTVFGKIIAFFDGEQYNTSGDVSGSAVRYYAIIKPIEAFFKSPLFGWGYEGLRLETFIYTKGMNTCTFVNWFAVYGILFGIVMLIGFIKFSKKIGKKTMITSLVFIILFVITMSENYVNNATIILLALYGYRQEKNGEKNENIRN